jgi:hypothetical protein
MSMLKLKVSLKFQSLLTTKHIKVMKQVYFLEFKKYSKDVSFKD